MGVVVVKGGGDRFVGCVYYDEYGCCCVSCVVWGWVVGAGVC